MAKKIDIGGELHSVATDHKVADASEIKDISKGNKSQAAFNNDVDRHEVDIHGTGGINDRLDDLEAMEQIVIDGGEAQIAQGSDFTNPDATKRAKIPTVGAIVDGLNDGVYDVSKRNPTAGPNSDGKFTLDYILDNANTLIPTGWRHGGMTISFVQSSDNKYIQARCMAQNFTTDVTQWQGVDEKPIVGSHNLVESGEVGQITEDLSGTIHINALSSLYFNKQGYIGIDGVTVYDNSTRIYGSGYILIQPSKKLYLEHEGYKLAAYLYNKNKEKTNVAWFGNFSEINVSSNEYYIRLSLEKTNQEDITPQTFNGIIKLRQNTDASEIDDGNSTQKELNDSFASQIEGNKSVVSVSSSSFQEDVFAHSLIRENLDFVGGYFDANGDIVETNSGSAYCSKKYLSLEEIRDLYINAGYKYRIVAYDNSKNYISTTGDISSDFNYTTQNNDIKYLRIYVSKSGSGITLSEAIANFSCYKKIKNNIDFQWTDNGCIGDDGSIIPTNYGSYSEPIRIPTNLFGNNLYYYALGNGYKTAFYDEDGVLIGSPSVVLKKEYWQVMEIPSTARYVRFSTGISGKNDAVAFFYTDKNVDIIDTLSEEGSDW